MPECRSAGVPECRSAGVYCRKSFSQPSHLHLCIVIIVPSSAAYSFILWENAHAAFDGFPIAKFPWTHWYFCQWRVCQSTPCLETMRCGAWSTRTQLEEHWSQLLPAYKRYLTNKDAVSYFLLRQTFPAGSKPSAVATRAFCCVSLTYTLRSLRSSCVSSTIHQRGSFQQLPQISTSWILRHIFLEVHPWLIPWAGATFSLHYDRVRTHGLLRK